MKILNWFQRRISGKQEHSKPRPVVAPYKEEFSDWPDGLLTIGTFGDSSVNNPEKPKVQGDPSSFPYYQEELAPEEYEFHKELDLLLPKQISPGAHLTEESRKESLPEEKYFDCLQNSEDNRNSSDLIGDDSETNDNHLQRIASLIYTKEKDVRLNNKNNVLGRKSLSYLLKKAFVCSGGFAPTPILRDSLADPKFEKSRMEKILRTILHKKIYPQGSTPRANARKYLDSEFMPEIDYKDENYEKETDGSKWVKTDSEYIVLEI